MLLYRMKRYQYVFGMLLLAFVLYPWRVFAAAGEPQLTAQAAILVEASTGRVLYEKNADDTHYPASMTKMMTCILGLERNTPGTLVRVSANAAGAESSELELAAGDSLRFSELLQGMMLVSDNAAAVVAAEYLGGSVDGFAAMMNEKAAALGMTGTHFANPNGLPDENHYTTARDMICLARYAWQNPQFRRIVGVQKQNIYWQYPRGKTIEAESTNELLGVYKGMNGIKTGYTRAAGGCLAGAAERDGVQLISVVMGTEGYDLRFPETAALLDYGFARVKRARLLERQQAVRTIHVHNGRDYKMQARPAADVWVPLVDGEDIGHYSVSYDVPRYTTAPVQAGDSVGSLIVSYDGREVERVPLIADSAVSRGFSLMSFLTGIYDGVYSVVFA